MLILTRRPGEQTVLTLPDGQEITVTSLGVKGNQTRLGFDAPKDVIVHRDEVHKRIQAEKQQEARA